MSLFTLAPYLVSWAVIPFASDAIFFDTNYGCANPNPATPANPCWPPRMTANTWVIRLLQGFLSVTAAVAVALMALWFKKPHGASNDPTSIAAVAAIASHPDILRDFSCPAEATSEELRISLRGKRYQLGEYHSADGTLRYGMVPAPTSSSDVQLVAAKTPTKFGSMFNASWKTSALTKDVIYLSYLLAILGITSAYLRDIEKSPIAKMFEHSSVGRRLVFAVLAAIASVYFSVLERGIMVSLHAAFWVLTNSRHANSRSIHGPSTQRCDTYLNHPPPQAHTSSDVLHTHASQSSFRPRHRRFRRYSLRVPRHHTFRPTLSTRPAPIGI